MGFPRGMRRDRVALERRRLQAARLLEQGLTEAEVARRLGVHRQSVNRWAKALKVEGRAGLHRAPRAGRPPKLNEAEMAQLEQCLKQGPEQFGYLSGLWTLARVAKLIEQQHGVRYDASQVWRILRKLNWSCQRPTGRARERDEQAIQQWKKVRWPQLKKKALREGRTVLFIDESGLSERPHRVRTWAPRGQTPVLVGSRTGARAVGGGLPRTLFRLGSGFTVPPWPRFQFPPRQTEQADFPHSAFLSASP